MKIDEQLMTPVIEAKYLTVENADRYRPILRLFYLNYEKLHYWLDQEEVYAELKQSLFFAEYTPEACQQDLAALTAWGNLLTVQDTRRAATIEEFKNKKFRYQLSEYSVEIERMVLRLENLFIEGASLEPSLLERIRLELARMGEISAESDGRIYSWWNDLNNDFVRLNQNYQDYMRELNSLKAEELMKQREFLAFKDHLVDYLRSFVKSLQLNVNMIEQHLKQMDEAVVEGILNKVTAYELSIPRLEVEVNEAQIRDKMAGRWESIKSWFIGMNGQASEAGKVFDTTNDIIRRITRYAARISEMANSGANRREEYAKLAVMFGRCTSIEEAHRLSANVFGIERPVHLKGDFKRATDSFNSGVFDEEPARVTIAPRVRNFKEKAKRSGIVDRSADKQATREASLKRLKEEQKLLQSFIKNGRLDFAALPVLEPAVRDAFLVWLSKALERKDRQAKTEEGRSYRVIEEQPGQKCLVQCTDGALQMPAYSIIFDGEC